MEHTIIASKGGTIELVEVVSRDNLSLTYRSVGEVKEHVLKKKGRQWKKEFPNTDDAIDWIMNHKEKSNED